MSERKPNFQNAQDLLASKVSQGNVLKRIGMLIKATLSPESDVDNGCANAASLEQQIEGLGAKTQKAFRRHLAELSDDVDRLTVEFMYAQSNKLSGPEQVALFLSCPDSKSVAFAAAKQDKVPLELQKLLVSRGFEHVEAMQALARNMNTHPSTLLPLTTHPNLDVRSLVAAHIGPRMRKIEGSLDEEKHLVINSLIEQYEDVYAPFIIPVCKDPEKLQWMYERSSLTPSTAALFVENPFSNNEVLLSIVSSTKLGLLPNGRTVKEGAAARVQHHLRTNEPSFN